MSDKPKIYVWCNSCAPQWHSGMAMAEDGTHLAGHISSGHGFLVADMGVAHTTAQHDKYDAHYPNGWEIVYLDDKEAVNNCAGLDEAYRLNQLAGKAAEDAKSSVING